MQNFALTSTRTYRPTFRKYNALSGNTASGHLWPRKRETGKARGREGSKDSITNVYPVTFNIQ
jgi:hypothetical protein